jgi:hypothetical protein
MVRALRLAHCAPWSTAKLLFVEGNTVNTAAIRQLIAAFELLMQSIAAVARSAARESPEDSGRADDFLRRTARRRLGFEP